MRPFTDAGWAAQLQRSERTAQVNCKVRFSFLKVDVFDRSLLEEAACQKFDRDACANETARRPSTSEIPGDIELLLSLRFLPAQFPFHLEYLLPPIPPGPPPSIKLPRQLIMPPS